MVFIELDQKIKQAIQTWRENYEGTSPVTKSSLSFGLGGANPLLQSGRIF